MTWKIEITEPHSGELGEAIDHADHEFAMEEYSYEQGRILEVYVHNASSEQWHIFTDLDSGHRFKIPPSRYRKVAEVQVA
jgi:hypothetical protein